MRNQLIETILREKLIVIIRGVEKNKLIPLAEALYAGGIRLMEVTYSADGTVSDEETAAQIAMLSSHMQGRMTVGAGTVLTEEQVQRTADAGGHFIISPDTFPDVIRKTRECGMVSIPGAMTPTEIQNAVRAGADFIKLFPASTFGTDYIKAITAPLSHVKLLAVGGITLDNIGMYRSVGIRGFGIGASIVKKSLIDSGNFEAVTALAKQYRDAVIAEEPLWQST